MEMKLSVREFHREDITHIADYWLTSGEDHLMGMGVDLGKLPTRSEWEVLLDSCLTAPPNDQLAYYVIWEINGSPVGHCNINMIKAGIEAHLHLHLWHKPTRAQGAGTRFVQLSLPYFFKTYDLKRVICEPYALNRAPNQALAKAGFRFVRQYLAVPGTWNFEQPVNKWVFEAHQLCDV